MREFVKESSFVVQSDGFLERLLSRDLNKIQEGIGEKVSMFVYFVASFASCITNAFLHGWELTLVILAGMPVSAAPVHCLTSRIICT